MRIATIALLSLALLLGYVGNTNAGTPPDAVFCEATWTAPVGAPDRLG